MNDVVQFEHQYVIQTKTRHRTPIVRTTSITNVDENQRGPGARGAAPVNSIERARINRIKRASMKRIQSIERRESGSSTPDVEGFGRGDSESSDSAGEIKWSKCSLRTA